MSQDDTERKKLQKARKYLARARIYRFTGLCFAILGVLLFVYFYLTRIEGHLFEALRSPSVIVMILFPFFPAAILAWLSSRAEKKFFKIMRLDQG